MLPGCKGFLSYQYFALLSSLFIGIVARNELIASDLMHIHMIETKYKLKLLLSGLSGRENVNISQFDEPFSTKI